MAAKQIQKSSVAPNRMCVCVGYVIAECQPLPVFQQIQKTRSIAAVYFWMFKHRWSALHLCFSGVEEQQVLWVFSQREEEGSFGTGNTDRFPRWEALLACHGFTEEKHNERWREEAHTPPPEIHRPVDNRTIYLKNP